MSTELRKKIHAHAAERALFVSRSLPRSASSLLYIRRRKDCIHPFKMQKKNEKQRGSMKRS